MLIHATTAFMLIGNYFINFQRKLFNFQETFQQSFFNVWHETFAAFYSQLLSF